MRKWMSQTGVPIVLSTALAIGAGGTPLYAMTVPEVIAAVETLPTVKEVQEMPQEKQQALYENLKKVWAAYEAFSEEDKQQLEEVKKVEALLTWFSNTQTMLLTGEDTTQWIPFEKDKNFTWSLSEDGTLTIRGKGAMPDLSTSPWDKEQIKKVVIEEGVTSIGDNAFLVCSNLNSIELPTSLNTIGYRAFGGCSSLNSINLPTSLNTIGVEAFNGCSGLTSIKLPDSINTIRAGAFMNCSGLRSIELPANLKTIEANAFNGCSSLTSIELPDSLNIIGAGTFNGCSDLTSIKLPANLNTIGVEAFYGCSGLTSIALPANLKTIEGSAFYGCSGLTSIALPANLDTIREYVFQGCSGLTSIALPANLNTIEGGAFFGCSGFTSVELPTNLNTIEYSAFYGCSGLTSIELPERLTSIGDWAFQYCSKLETLIFKTPNPPTLGKGAFDGISTSLRICIPANANEVDYKASGLPEGEIYQQIGESNTYYRFDETSNTLIITGTGAMPDLEDYLWDSQKAAISTVVVEEGVTSIGNGAFNGCSDLTSVKLPDTLTSIGDNAFNGCSDLTSVALPTHLQSIGNGAFNGCSLDSIKIPTDMKSIGESAFSDNSNLKEVTFEGNAPTLGHNVFEGCSNDLTIYIPENATGYNEEGNWPVSHILYKLNVSTTHEGGTMEPLKPFAKAGETITLTPKADDGYRFKEWKVRPNVTIKENTFTMPADHITIEPIFVKLYSITLKNEMGGVQSTVKIATKKGHKLR